MLILFFFFFNFIIKLITENMYTIKFFIEVLIIIIYLFFAEEKYK